MFRGEAPMPVLSADKRPVLWVLEEVSEENMEPVIDVSEGREIAVCDDLGVVMHRVEFVDCRELTVERAVHLG